MISVCTQTVWTLPTMEDVHYCPWPTDGNGGIHKFKTTLSKRHFQASQHQTASSDILTVQSSKDRKYISNSNDLTSSISSSGITHSGSKNQQLSLMSMNNHLQQQPWLLQEPTIPTPSSGEPARFNDAVPLGFLGSPNQEIFGSPSTPDSPLSRSHSVELVSLCSPDAGSSGKGGMDTILRQSFQYSTGGFHQENMAQDLTKPSIPHTDSGEIGDEFNYSGKQETGNVPQVSSTSSWNPEPKAKRTKKESACNQDCQVCGDAAAGLHCGAFVCEACKKFYIRGSKQQSSPYTCTDPAMKKSCSITKKSRTSCSYCRYQKCLAVGMHLPGHGMLDIAKVSWKPCTVCGAASSGFHFGALTCEGCKSFFRRCLKDSKSDSLMCKKGGKCEEGGPMRGRDVCRPCRLAKCTSVGMSASSSRVGRQPNSLRYARIMQFQDTSKPQELKHPQIKQEQIYDHESSSPHHSTDSGLNKEMIEDHYDEAMQYSSREESLAINSLTVEEKQILSVQEVNYIEYRTSLFKIHNALLEDRTLPKMVMGKEMMRCFLENLEKLLIFIKTVHGFTSLTIDDRVKLTQRCIYPQLLLPYSQRFNLDTNEFTWFNASYELGKRWVATFPEYKPTWFNFRDIGRRIKLLDMTDIEQSLLAVILFVSPDDQADMTAPEPAFIMQEKYIRLLSQHVIEVYGPKSNRMEHLRTLLIDLRRAGQQHTQAAKYFSQNHPNISIPELYNEMFVNNNSSPAEPIP